MKKNIFFLLVFSNLLFSQDYSGSLIYQNANTFKTGLFFQYLKIGDDIINQVAIPVSLTVPIKQNLTLNIFNIPAFSGSNITEVNALTETRIGIRYVTLQDRLLAKAVVGLPTGKTKYSIDQFNLIKYLSTISLEYPVSFYGRGFNTNLGFSYAYPLTKTLVFGAGLSYYFKGGFYPLDLKTGGEYDPGDETTINAGVDYVLNKDIRFGFDLIYTNYMYDKVDGIKKFQAAPKFTVYSSFQYKYEKTTHNIFFLNRFKGINNLYFQGKDLLSENGNQLELGYYGIVPLSFDLSILWNADGKFYGDIQQMVVGDFFETGKTNIFSFGLGIRSYLTDRLLLEVNARYKTGDIRIIQGNISHENGVRGYNITSSIAYRF